ncbi:MAG: hypothetical protein RR893_08900, partial [Clostridia bacterium]
GKHPDRRGQSERQRIGDHGLRSDKVGVSREINPLSGVPKRERPLDFIYGFYLLTGMLPDIP